MNNAGKYPCIFYVNANELPANYLVELGVKQILNVVQMEYYRRFMEYDGKSIDNIPLL